MNEYTIPLVDKHKRYHMHEYEVRATRAIKRRGREGDEGGVSVVEVVLAQGTTREKPRHRAGTVQSSTTGPFEGVAELPAKSHCSSLNTL